jgi:hypothetical protein
MVYFGFNKSTSRSSEWHCRIDVPYAILEHTILSVENGTHSAMTLTLRSPPKIYEIVNTEDIYLYTGQSVEDDTGVISALSNLTLGTSRSPKLGRSRSPKLERLCTLHPEYNKNGGLCMAYKLCFANTNLVHQVSTVLKSFSVPELHDYKTSVPEERKSTIEMDIAKLEEHLSRSALGFAVQFQVLALVFEGTVTPAKITQLLPTISSMANKYGPQSSAAAVRFLGRQLPTPALHVDSSSLDLLTMNRHLKQGIKIGREPEYCGSHKEHKK